MQTQTTYQIGKTGEELATDFLVGKDFQILHQNYRYGRLEIDLIAQKDNLIIFVEVKLRKNARYGYPEQAVTATKKRNIQIVASYFLDMMQWKGNIRFDIIAILKHKDSCELLHFEDAF